MKTRAKLLLTCAFVALLPPGAARAGADDAAALPGDIIVTAEHNRETGAITGLPLTIRQTPQSVSIIDRERMEAFALTNVNDLLDQAVGINVERAETDRTQYNSRGFDVTNFQVDGIGLPLRWGIQFGDLDTALFERVEIVRGANALMTGIGNPSATINYVRKMPTSALQGSATASYGSWNNKRIDLDASGPLTGNGALTARAIFAYQNRDNYLTFNESDRMVIGLVAAWQIAPQLKATVGYSRQENNARGVLWGALPLVYSDGGQITYPRSASTAADWTMWNVHDQSAFAELAYGSDGGWQGRGRLTWNNRQSFARLLYAYGYPDRESGLGVYGMTGQYGSPSDQYLGDFQLGGPVKLLGREHRLSFGLSTARMDSKEYEAFSDASFVFPGISGWAKNGVDFEQPAYPEASLAENVTDKMTRAYGAMHANIADSLKAVVGASAVWLTTTGESYLIDQGRKDSKVSPYLGLVFDATQNISFYASYTDIYLPQSEVDITNLRLAPARGTSLEGGIKSEWFDGRLLASAALFKVRQDGLAEAAGVFGANGPGPIGKTYFVPVDTRSKGFEIELSGHVTPNWALSGGYTGLEVEDDAGDRTRTFVPRKSLKLASSYTVPEWKDLRLGAQLRWQSAVTAIDEYVINEGVTSEPATIRQSPYAVVDLAASIKPVEHVRLSLNLRNVGNAKYLNSLMWGQAFYAAPRSVLVSLGADF